MSKFIKARCKKTGRWYGLEVKSFGRIWKVVNMLDLSDSEAAVTSSEVRQDTFLTADNLLACQQCGGRKVGGCKCFKKKNNCSKSMKYQFQCTYCDELEIDYSLPTRAVNSGKEGETIRLSQGQEVKIKYADNRPLTRINVGVGWDPAVTGSDIDVDSSVFVMSGQRKEYELVYFGNKEHGSGCVIHHGDNLTGANIANSDDENISVYLNKVPANRDRLVFVLNIYDCLKRKQTFGGIKNLYIRLYDPDSKKALIEYKVLGNFSRDTALIIGMAYRKDGSWMFKAVGKGSIAADLYRLSEECLRDFI